MSRIALCTAFALLLTTRAATSSEHAATADAADDEFESMMDGLEAEVPAAKPKAQAKRSPPQPEECRDVIKFSHHVSMGIAKPSDPARWKAASTASRSVEETFGGGKSKQRDGADEKEKASLREAEEEERRSAPDGWASDNYQTMFRRTGGWNETHDDALWTDTCTIERVAAGELTPARFQREFLQKKPVLIRGASDITPFKRATRRDVLLYCYGDFDVTLSTANKNSYVKSEASFRYYANAMLDPQPIEASGADTKYFFGDNRHDEWQALFQHYRKPTQYIFDEHTALSFGVGASGSGVPFHTHGHVFAEVFHGYKRWFLADPEEEPEFDPDESSLRWTLLKYPKMSEEARSKILDCVAFPGEILYIPHKWHHATLNIGQGVFMSTFV